MKNLKIGRIVRSSFLPLAALSFGAGMTLAEPAGPALDNAPPMILPGAGPEGIVTVASGVIELIRESEASLQSGCTPTGPAAGSIVVQVRVTYAALDNVCGVPGLAACDGRVTEIVESCAGPDSTGTSLTIGGAEVMAQYLTGQVKVRRCFDPFGVSDCTGASPAAEIISDGEQISYGFSRPDSANPERNIITRTIEALGYDIAEIDGRSSVSAPGWMELRHTYGEGLNRDICGFRGIAEATGGPFATRPCELAFYGTSGRTR